MIHACFRDFHRTYGIVTYAVLSTALAELQKLRKLHSMESTSMFSFA